MAEQKNRGGRPPMHEEDRHSQKVTIYLTNNQKVAIDRISESKGLAPARLIRDIINDSQDYREWIAAHSSEQL